MIHDGNLARADHEAVARLFCWLTFRPMHLDHAERALLGRVREAMGSISVRVRPALLGLPDSQRKFEISFWEYS
jgi:hypothetical protein